MTMELMIRDGDYVPGGGSFRTAEGAEELLERVLFKLQARLKVYLLWRGEPLSVETGI